MNKEHAFQDILDNAKKVFTDARPGFDCPDVAMLTDYACQDLPVDDIVHVKFHLQTCETCHMLVLRLEADHLLWNDMLNRDPGTALAQALGREGRKKVKSLIRRAAGRQSTFVSKILEAMITWVSPLWHPLYAGEAVTAVDIAEQNISFEMEYGEYIDLSCHWQDDKEGDPCIDLSWQANLLQPSRLWARFVEPESGTVLAEIFLGSELEGKVHIKSSDLSFNPVTRKWAVSIIVEES